MAKLKQAIEADLPRAPRGLFSAWAEMLPIISRQRREPSYVFVPELPAPAGFVSTHR